MSFANGLDGRVILLLAGFVLFHRHGHAPDEAPDEARHGWNAELRIESGHLPRPLEQGDGGLPVLFPDVPHAELVLPIFEQIRSTGDCLVGVPGEGEEVFLGLVHDGSLVARALTAQGRGARIPQLDISTAEGLSHRPAGQRPGSSPAFVVIGRSYHRAPFRQPKDIIPLPSVFPAL